MEQKNLENQIKQTNNKQVSIVEINRKKEVDAEIEKIIQEADILAKSLGRGYCGSRYCPYKF